MRYVRGNAGKTQRGRVAYRRFVVGAATVLSLMAVCGGTAAAAPTPGRCDGYLPPLDCYPSTGREWKQAPESFHEPTDTKTPATSGDATSSPGSGRGGSTPAPSGSTPGQ